MRHLFRGLLLMTMALMCFALTGCFGFFCFRFLSAGAGVESAFFLAAPAESVLLGTIPVVGFLSASLLCLLLGLGLCAYAVVPPIAPEQESRFPEGA